MAHGIPARLTPHLLRRFGLAVGDAFAAFALLLWWRGGETGRWIAGAVAAVLLGGGVLAPSALGPVYRGWMRASLLLSRVTTPIVMALIFYVIITPFGLLMRLFRHQPLVHGAGLDTFWIDRPAGKRRSLLDRPF